MSRIVKSRSIDQNKLPSTEFEDVRSLDAICARLEVVFHFQIRPTGQIDELQNHQAYGINHNVLPLVGMLTDDFPQPVGPMTLKNV